MVDKTDKMWHMPDWDSVSIFVPNIGHYHLLYVDVTSHPQNVMFVGGHGTDAFLNLISERCLVLLQLP